MMRQKNELQKKPSSQNKQGTICINNAAQCKLALLGTREDQLQTETTEISQSSLLSLEHSSECSGGGNGGAVGPGPERDVAELRNEACTDLDGSRDVPVQHVAV